MSLMMLAGMGMSALSSAYQAYSNGKAAQAQAQAKSMQIQQQALAYKSKALQDEVQAGAYIVQGKAYEYQQSLADMNASQANSQIYNAYEMGAWLAMQQGFADREKLSATRVAASHSGVKMDEGSKKEVYESEYLKKELNRIALQKQTVSSANKARISEANYRGQSAIAGGNAKAAELMSEAALLTRDSDNLMAEAVTTLSKVPTESTAGNPLWGVIAAGAGNFLGNYLGNYNLIGAGSNSPIVNNVANAASKSILQGLGAISNPTASQGFVQNAASGAKNSLSNLGKSSFWIW